MNQTALAIVWIWSIASIPTRSPAPLAPLGRVVFWLLTTTHVLEILVYYRRIQEASGNLSYNLARTLIWGDLYLREIEVLP